MTMRVDPMTPPSGAGFARAARRSSGPAPRAASSSSSALPWVRLAPWMVTLFVFLVFLRTLGFGLYLDDNHHARPWGVGEVLGTFAGPFDPLGIEPPYFRPVAVVTFAIDWLLWGFDPWGYHLTNVALHAAVSVLVLFLLRRLRVSPAAAVAGALYFAIIPANAATAIYVSERSDALVALFGISSLLSLARYFEGQRTRWLWAMNGFLLLALSSKEVGVAVPLLIALFWGYLIIGSGPEQRPGYTMGPRSSFESVRPVARAFRAELATPARRSSALRICLPTFVLLAIYAVHRTTVLPSGLLGARYGDANLLHGFASAFFWTFKAVPWEVSAFAFPVLGLAVVIALAFGPRPRSFVVILFGALWVAAGCLPLAYIGQVEPRLLYLPEVGHAIVFAGIFTTFSDALEGRAGRWWPRGVRVALVAVVSAALAVALVVTQKRAQDQFRPLGYKMLKGYRIVVEGGKKDLYPRRHVVNAERILRYAREQNLDGAR